MEDGEVSNRKKKAKRARSSRSSMAESMPVKCRRCDALIPVAAARRNRGYCKVCLPTPWGEFWVRELRMMCELAGVLLALPFVVLWHGCRDRWRWWRFPLDKKGLRERIWAVHEHPRVRRRYLRGVIDGYWGGDEEELRRVRWYQPAASIVRGEDDEGMERSLLEVDPARAYGLGDGVRLMRGELAVEEIPTYREVIEAVEVEEPDEGAPVDGEEQVG